VPWRAGQRTFTYHFECRLTKEEILLKLMRIGIDPRLFQLLNQLPLEWVRIRKVRVDVKVLLPLRRKDEQREYYQGSGHPKQQRSLWEQVPQSLHLVVRTSGRCENRFGPRSTGERSRAKTITFLLPA
jgi:hypothetical protein